MYGEGRKHFHWCRKYKDSHQKHVETIENISTRSALRLTECLETEDLAQFALAAQESAAAEAMKLNAEIASNETQAIDRHATDYGDNVSCT